MSSIQGLENAPSRLVPPAFDEQRSERNPHLVQFYENEEMLYDVVGDFLAAGLMDGDHIIVIATEAHRRGFTQRLAAKGHSVQMAALEGQFVLLDAHELLGRFMGEALPIREKFNAVVTPILQKARTRSRSGHTRAYGEMVDILWQKGNFDGAIKLEEFWNDIQEKYSFSLLCAYATPGFGKSPKDMERVCAQHTHLIGTDSIGNYNNPAPTRSVHTAPASEPVTENDFSAVAGRADQLTSITAAIADAVEPADVFEAIVDQVALALGASSAALFMRRENERVVDMLRAVGYARTAAPAIASLSLDTGPALPVLDVIRTGTPKWIDSQKELLALYPHLATLVSPTRAYSIGCVPLTIQGRVLAALAFTFENAPPLVAHQRRFLMLVARYAGQALERLRLLEVERNSRTAAEAGAARMEVLYTLAASMNSAASMETIFETALTSVQKALDASRSSILVCDADGTMRFRAWRGLSETYRRAVDGHSPWTRDSIDPQPILVPDVRSDPAMTAYLPVFTAEGILSLGFIPLVANGKLIGKFMVYFAEPHSVSPDELSMVRAIADHVAAAIARFAATAELKETVHFNEMFAGILGHDLRNPLSAIMAAAQVAALHSHDEKSMRPLGRILSSGQRMSTMIDQLLDFTRVRVGHGISLERRHADAAVILRQILDEHESAHPDWTMRFECNGDTTGTWDTDRLYQVFSNLVGNSVQHGVKSFGGKVIVDGTHSDRIEVTVHNMGVVPSDVLPRMFDAMAAGDDRHCNSPGLGLGLFITRELVTSHNGHISVKSDEQSGTTVTVVLPRVAEV